MIYDRKNFIVKVTAAVFFRSAYTLFGNQWFCNDRLVCITERAVTALCMYAWHTFCSFSMASVRNLLKSNTV